MLDTIVLSYGGLDPAAFFLIAAGLITLGGVIAALVLPTPAEPLRRSTYFYLSSLALFLLSAAQLVWFLYVPALRLGASFLLMLTDFASCLAFGAYSAQIARARSLDAYGHGRHAWMAFVPLANLWLLFKSPLQPVEAPGAGWRILAGLVLALFSRLVTDFVEGNGEVIARQIQADPEVAALVQSLNIRAQGIEAALDELILAEGAPVVIDATLTLQTVTRDGRTVTYDYVLDDPTATALDPAYRNQVRASMCGGLLAYLEAGATARIRFARKDGAQIEVLALSVTECTA